jgi:hypothetical protein
VESILKVFEEEGYTILSKEEASQYPPHEFPSQKSIKRDIDFDSLLLFPPTTNFYNHFLLNCGKIILQDKVTSVISLPHFHKFHSLSNNHLVERLIVGECDVSDGNGSYV